MTTTERIELLEEARDALELAIQNVKDAVRGSTEQARCEAYIIPHLESWLFQEATSIDALIEDFGDMDDEDDDEFDV